MFLFDGCNKLVERHGFKEVSLVDLAFYPE
jgi:hypothetical protein